MDGVLFYSAMNAIKKYIDGKKANDVSESVEKAALEMS